MIQNYIDKESLNSNKFDSEAYYDLFFIRSKSENLSKLESDIDLLKKRHPIDAQFLEGIKGSIYNSIQSTDYKKLIR